MLSRVLHLLQRYGRRPVTASHSEILNAYAPRAPSARFRRPTFQHNYRWRCLTAFANFSVRVSPFRGQALSLVVRSVPVTRSSAACRSLEGTARSLRRSPKNRVIVSCEYRDDGAARRLVRALAPEEPRRNRESYGRCPICCDRPPLRGKLVAALPGRQCSETNDAKAQPNSSRASADSRARNHAVACQFSNVPRNGMTSDRPLPFCPSL